MPLPVYAAARLRHAWARSQHSKACPVAPSPCWRTRAAQRTLRLVPARAATPRCRAAVVEEITCTVRVLAAAACAVQQQRAALAAHARHAK